VSGKNDHIHRKGQKGGSQVRKKNGLVSSKKSAKGKHKKNCWCRKPKK